MQQNISLKANSRSASQIPRLLILEVSLPCLQEPVTGACSAPD